MEKRSFTLVELMVVIAIVGILSATVIPQVIRSIDKARVARTGAELKMIQLAMDAYYADTGSYPPSVSDWGRAWGADVGLVDRGNVVGGHLTSWNGPYLKNWPIKTAWGDIIGCGAQGAYYIHPPIGWINRDGIAGNDYWIHMNPYCVRYPPQVAIDIDRAVDNGNAGSGDMRLTGGVPEYVYFYVGEGTRSW
ncbi:MAG: prepilin-type N-terminal cleavage/methylation domain-containing protein [Candidatus Omnitrophica bacterium]|nr:prepilin-type N-terminal cleavage/methylation domain-containing protein [Candidatus Omnitrophota bacterium]